MYNGTVSGSLIRLRDDLYDYVFTRYVNQSRGQKDGYRSHFAKRQMNRESQAAVRRHSRVIITEAPRVELQPSRRAGSSSI